MADLTLQMLVRLVDEFSDPARSVTKNTRALASAFRSLEKVNPGKNLSTFNSSVTRLTRSSLKASSAISGLKDDFRGVRREAKALKAVKVSRTLDRISTSGKRASKTIRDIEFGKALLSGAQGLNTLDRGMDRLFRRPIENARDFGKALGNVAGIVDTSKIDLDELRQRAFDLSEEFGIDSTNQIGAFYKAFSTGAKTAEEAQLRVDAANRLSVGGVGDLEKTFKLLTSTQDAFGLGAKDAGFIADAFFSAVKEGDTDLNQLSGKFGKISAQASLFGLELKETTNLIAAGSRVLPTTAQSVDGLRAALKNLGKPTKTAASELRKLFGRKVSKRFESDTKGVIKQFGGFDGVLRAIVKRSGNADTSLKRVFGSIQGLGFASAIAGNDFKILNETIDNNQDVSGRAAEALEKVKKADPGFKLRQQEARFKNLSIEIGNSAIPAINELIEANEDSIKGIVEWIKENPKLIGTLAKFALGVKVANLVFGPFVTGLGTMVRFFQISRGGIDGARIAMGKFGKVSKGIKGALVTPVGGVGKVSAAFSLLGAAALGFQIGEFLDEKFGLSTKLGDALSDEDVQAAGDVENLVDALQKARNEGGSPEAMLALIAANRESFNKALEENSTGLAGVRQDLRKSITGTNVNDSFRTALEILDRNEERIQKSIEKTQNEERATRGDPEKTAKENEQRLDDLTAATKDLSDTAKKGTKLDIIVSDNRIEVRSPGAPTQFIEQGRGLAGSS